MSNGAIYLICTVVTMFVVVFSGHEEEAPCVPFYGVVVFFIFKLASFKGVWIALSLFVAWFVLATLFDVLFMSDRK
jgi:hypothetical protein